ncbi:centromere protein F isoform X2 [Trematomus bernacchii]|uniref:centromere protein F isoform X2 n=1 Tax=Trematomus bernacchii TaxID=40690 RepID=UPI00146E941F|nr:centromere protein F isoform X2 [Trematomus bernacchii]
MSWAEEDWTVGLSGRVLQKVKELQVNQERLSRESKQKQLQLDNIHTSLEKQTSKYEEVHGELVCTQRELQSVSKEAKAAVSSSERLTQELHTKQAQVCSLEGQADAARTLNNKLTQEVKRLEVELEKLQNSSRLADTTLFSTPCWNTASPWESNGSRKEERSGHKDEGQSRALHSRQLQFPEAGTASLPRQQHKSTPHRHPSDQSEIFSTPLVAFPWERDDSRSAARRPSPSSPQTPCTEVVSQSEQRAHGKETERRTEPDTSLSEAQSRVSALEAELCGKAEALKSIQNEMVQSKKELAVKDVSIQKARNELSVAHTRMAQESERASGAEQKLKHLQEELKCQRQNTESSRLQHQQRSKELEKQHQRDLTELQKERQSLEKQHQQEVNKLNQELQQARTLHHALQAQADKLSLQKQALDKELDTLKGKLKWTEGQLQESQKKEAQTQAKLTEALREAEGVAVSLEQSRKRERALEEEGRRLAEERADALRLLKELQEEKAVQAPPHQPVQFCPAGQSFSPHPSYSPHSGPPTHIKKPRAATLAEQKREEDLDLEKRRAEIAASYPADREPGEGRDAEHITDRVSPDSESFHRGGGHRGNSSEENNSRNEVIKSDSTGTNKHSTFDQALSSSSPSDAGTPTNISMDVDQCSPNLCAEETPSLKPSEDLKRENASLRSELQDAEEELQKRLEDLEAQRRAETEARTRLKQLGRKLAGQTAEKDEQEKQWRAQLESEKEETERLRKAMAAMETEMTRGREETERTEIQEQEEGKNKALEDRESEMIELNIQLKKQLGEVKAQLALEREEREREEDERRQRTETDQEQLEQLQAELEELKLSREEDSLGEDKLSVANSPLTYLSLRDDEFNSNIDRCDNKLLPSPEQHLLFCQSTNQRNMLASQASGGLMTQGDQTVIESVLSPLSNEGHTASDRDDHQQNYLRGSSQSDQSLSDLQEVETTSSDVAKEVECLQKQTAKETERANQYQVKLEALQSQVTRQTKQLTMAFENQSQHISGLLAELQEKDSALLSQGEELQRHKQELDVLKIHSEEKTREGMTVKEVEHGEQKETRVERSIQSHQENKCAVTVLETNSAKDGVSDAQRDAGQLESVTQINQDSACVMGETQGGGTADVNAEPLTLLANQQLRLEGVSISDSRAPAAHTDSENKHDLRVKQSQDTGNAAVCCLEEQRSPSVPTDISSDARPQDVSGRGDEGGDSERDDGRPSKAEEEQESELQIDRLHQQVEELQRRLRSLSAETQQQSQELVMWRLASKPAPTLDQTLPNTDNLQSETPEQIPAVRRSQADQQPGDEMTPGPAPPHGQQESPEYVTVIREDELLLSCSSNKLQGRMLFSRLQHSNLPEPKSLHPSKNTAELLENNRDTDTIDKESEKENQEINILHQSKTFQTQHKERRDTEVIQMISEKTGQPHSTKESLKVSGPKQTRSSECLPEATPDALTATSETNTTHGSSGKHGRTEMKSVSSQTEESLNPRSAPPELHCAHTQTEEEEEEELVESPPVSPITRSEAAELGLKVLFSGSFPIPSDPARLAERIRRNRTQLSAAFDDTEYEPYGLPEVVMKGFADIPSGPSCPYIVRRGLLGTSVVPAPQKDRRQEEETD